MKLIDLKCAHCGAPLHSTVNGMYRCEHCGAQYKVEGDCYDYHVIMVENPHIVTLKSVSRINQDDIARYGESVMAEYVSHQMKESLADQLTKLMRIDRSCDPFEHAVMVRGMIRVVEPDFRF